MKSKRGYAEGHMVIERRGRIPKEVVVKKKLKPVNAKFFGEAGVELGSKISREGTYSSVTCNVVVRLPVALEAPYNSEGFDDAPIRKGGIRAGKIADSLYEKLARKMEKAVFE